MEKKPLSVEDLKLKRYKSLLASAQAARIHPEEYRAAGEIARYVISSTIDISRYEQTARKLARCLEILMTPGAEAIFSYFHENIDPRKQGNPLYLRAMCVDLEKQMQQIDRVLAGKTAFRVIFPGCFSKSKNSDTPLK